MSKTITIGHTIEGHHPVRLNIDRLMTSRALITSSSGGGKSWLLRVILEGLSAHSQTLVFDPEGEFSSLREIRDMVLVGPDGDLPAEPRAAGLLCRRLMERNVSAVMDIFELPPAGRRQFMANFLTEMINLPKSLWRPCFVVIDEVHEFAPSDKAKDNVSNEPVALLFSKGRKRGYCPIVATQRLAKVNLDLAAEARTRFIGQTILDVDQKRAADFLGWGKDRWPELRDLSPPGHEGQFFGIGPAFEDRGIIKFRSGLVKSTHARAGQGLSTEPPAPSAKIRGVLGEMQDLGKQAEEEIRSLNEAKSKISQLERQVKTLQAPHEKVDATEVRQLRRRIAELTKNLEVAMKIVAEINSHGFDAAGVDPEQVKKAIEAAAQQILKMVEQGQSKREAEFQKLRKEATSLLAKLQKVLAGEDLNLKVDVKHNEPFTVRPSSPPPPIDISELSDSSGSYDTSGDKTSLDQRILNAIAWWESLGIKHPTRQQVAFVAKVRPTGGYFTNKLGETKTAGLLTYPANGVLALTEEGRAKASAPQSPPSYADLLKRARSILDSGLQQSIFDALVKAGGGPITREELAAAVNATASGGYFTNVIGSMRTCGVIKYPSKGSVSLGDAFTWKE